MKKTILTLLLLVGILSPSFSSYAYDQNGKQIGYINDEYLDSFQMQVFNGPDRYKYGKSMVGKISAEEKQKLLEDKKIASLIAVYNKLYQTTVKLYKLGEKHKDKWKGIDDPNDNFIGNISKLNFSRVYSNSVKILYDVSCFFDSKGLSQDDYLTKETKSMIDDDDALKFRM